MAENETVRNIDETINQAVQLFEQALALCRDKEPTDLEQEAKSEYFSRLYAANDLLVQLPQSGPLALSKVFGKIWDLHKRLTVCYAEGIGTSKDITKSRLHKALAEIYSEKRLNELNKQSRKDKLKRLPGTIFGWIFLTSLIIVCLSAFWSAAGIIMKHHLLFPLGLAEIVLCFCGAYSIIMHFIYAWTEELDNPIEDFTGLLLGGKFNISKDYKLNIKDEKGCVRKAFWWCWIVLQVGFGALLSLLFLSVIPLAIYFLYLFFLVK